MTEPEADARAAERALRDRAQADKGNVVEGSARAVEPRRLGHMLSVRLEPDLVGELREIAQARGMTISEIMRDAGRMFVDAYRNPPKPSAVVQVLNYFTSEQTSEAQVTKIAETA